MSREGSKESLFLKLYPILALGLIVIVSLFIRLQSIDEKYLLAYDPFYMLRIAEETVSAGYEHPPWDTKGYYPRGRALKHAHPLTPYFIAYFYKFLKFVHDTIGIFPELEKPETGIFFAAKIYPAIFGTIGIVFFLFAVKKLMDLKTGLMAAAFLAVSSGFFYRTTAGFADKEALGVSLMMAGLYCFVSGFTTTHLPASAFFGFISGVSLGLMSWGWGGYAQPFIIFAAFLGIEAILSKITPNFFLTGFFYSIGFFSLNFQFLGNLELYFIVAPILGGLIAISFFCTSFFIHNLVKGEHLLKVIYSTIIFLIIGTGVAYIKYGSFEAIYARMKQMYKSISQPILGTVHSYSVGEQQRTNPEDFIARFGSVRFHLFQLLVVPYSFIMPIFILKAIGIERILDMKFDEMTRRKYSFCLIFMSFSYYAAWTLVRLLFMFSPAISLFSAIIIKWFIEIPKYLKIYFGTDFLFQKAHTWGAFGIILFGYLLLSPDQSGGYYTTVAQARQEGINQVSNPTPDWEEGLKFLKENTPEDAVILTWWDYGYWLQTVAERYSIVDGANYIGEWNRDVGYFFLCGAKVQLRGGDVATKGIEKYECKNESYIYSLPKVKKVDINPKWGGDHPNMLCYHTNNYTKPLYIIIDWTMVPKFYWVSHIAENCRDDSCGTQYIECKYNERYSKRIPSYIEAKFDDIYLCYSSPTYDWYFRVVETEDGQILPYSVYKLKPPGEPEKEMRYLIKRYIKADDPKSKDLKVEEVKIENLEQMKAPPTPLIEGTLYFVSPRTRNLFTGSAFWIEPRRAENNIFSKMWFLNGGDLKNFKLEFISSGGRVKVFKVRGPWENKTLWAEKTTYLNQLRLAPRYGPYGFELYD